MPATAFIPQEGYGKISNSTSSTTTEMAGFFSLGRAGNPSANYPSPISNLQYQAAEEEEEACNSGNNKSANPITRHHHHHLHPHPNQISPAESLFLCRSDGISHKGFEFLQTQPQTLEQDHQISQIRLLQPSPPSSSSSDRRHHHHHDHRQDLYSAAVGLGVVGRSSGTCCNLMPPSSSSSTSPMMSCHDCGNQAKKDCSYMRCRTCCRNRGFRCDTHVKSTWVSAGKRREREQQQQQRERDHHHQENSSVKRPRENTNATTLTAGTEVSSNFPSEITSSAVFRCVKLSSYEDSTVNGGRDNVSDDHHHGIIAYQTAVTIGGHLFKGILYDHGLVECNAGGEGGGSAQRTQPTPAGLNLTAAGASSCTTVAVGAAGASVLAPPVAGSLSFLDHSTTTNTTTLLYPAASAAHQLSSFMECTQFFPNHRP